MVLLGLVLLAAAVVGGTEMAVSNRAGDVGFEVFNQGFAASPAGVFVLGAICACVALLGLFLITGAAQRRRMVRRDAKHRVRTVEDRMDELERVNQDLAAENERLRGELHAQERQAATLGGVAVPPGAGDVPYGDQVGDAVRSETVAETGHYEPYPSGDGPVSPIKPARTIDVTETGEEKADVLGRFRGSTD